MMKALTVTAQHTLQLADISKPEIGDYDALVSIKACGICSTTDRELIAGTQPYHSDYPCVLGHESIGEVVEVGPKVKYIKPGDLVTRPYGILPGQTRDGYASAWGGFSEYGTVTDRKAMMDDGDHSLADDYTALRQNVVPEGVSVKAAVLAISLAETASWAWLQPSAAGKNVVVFGTGIAGLTIALWWKMAGARSVTVVGRRQERLDLAKAVAADYAINSTEVDPAEELVRLIGCKADLGAEAVGSREVMKQIISSLGSGGTACIYGVPEGLAYELPMGLSAGNIDISLKPADEHVAYEWACRMIALGKIPVDLLMTHEFMLEEYDAAWQAVKDGNVVKSLLNIIGDSVE